MLTACIGFNSSAGNELARLYLVFSNQAKWRERPKLRCAMCFPCDNCGWVCENHPDRPRQGPRACECGGADALCPVCNRAEGHELPRLPFTTDDESKRH